MGHIHSIWPHIMWLPKLFSSFHFLVFLFISPPSTYLNPFSSLTSPSLSPLISLPPVSVPSLGNELSSCMTSPVTLAWRILLSRCTLASFSNLCITLPLIPHSTQGWPVQLRWHVAFIIWCGVHIGMNQWDGRGAVFKMIIVKGYFKIHLLHLAFPFLSILHSPSFTSHILHLIRTFFQLISHSWFPDLIPHSPSSHVFFSNLHYPPASIPFPSLQSRSGTVGLTQPHAELLQSQARTKSPLSRGET